MNPWCLGKNFVFWNTDHAEIVSSHPIYRFDNSKYGSTRITDLSITTTTTTTSPSFYSHYKGQPALAWRILLVQNFTARMPLLTATSAFGSEEDVGVPLNSVVYTVKGKVFPYSLPSVGPGADPGVQAVSPQVTWSESRHLLSRCFLPGLRLPP